MVSVLELQLAAAVIFLIALALMVFRTYGHMRKAGKPSIESTRGNQRNERGTAKKPAVSHASIRDEPEDFRLRYPATFRADDGHFVRSKAELIIDNWLHRHRIVHEYERKIPGQYMICDFYLPDHDVYLEFWGGGMPGYDERKSEKAKLYQELDLKLVSLEDADIGQLEYRLTRKLRPYGINV